MCQMAHRPGRPGETPQPGEAKVVEKPKTESATPGRHREDRLEATRALDRREEAETPRLAAKGPRRAQPRAEAKEPRARNGQETGRVQPASAMCSHLAIPASSVERPSPRDPRKRQQAIGKP